MTIFEQLKNWWLGTGKPDPLPTPDSQESVIVVKPEASPGTTPPAACGCGRSETGFCVGLHMLSDEEWAAKNAPAAEQVAPEPVMESAPVVPAPEVVPAKTKKERKPRTAKVVPPVVAPEPQPVVKKPARTSRKKSQ